MHGRRIVVFGVPAALTLLASSARADVHELRHDVPVDVAITATAAALVFASEAGKADLAPAACRWCDRDASGASTLNGLDASTRDALKWSDPRLAGHIADGVGFLGVPLMSFATLSAAAANDHRFGSATAVDMLLVAEPVMLSGVLNQTVKLIVGRERPFVHALPDDEKAKTRHPSDNNLSFYSGHTSLTFTTAMASGTIASLRGYRLAPVVWAATTSLAATTGYLRIAADKHYLTDVLTGAVLGTAMGVLVPLLFHGRRPEDASPGTAAASPSALGGTPTASLSGAF